MAEKKKEVGIAWIIALIVAAIAWMKAKAAPPEPGLATLWGIVTDASTGKSISGIEASLNSLPITTGTDGRYEFANVEPGTYSLVFTDPMGRYETLEV